MDSVRDMMLAATANKVATTACCELLGEEAQSLSAATVSLTVFQLYLKYTKRIEASCKLLNKFPKLQLQLLNAMGSGAPWVCCPPALLRADCKYQLQCAVSIGRTAMAMLRTAAELHADSDAVWSSSPLQALLSEAAALPCPPKPSDSTTDRSPSCVRVVCPQKFLQVANSRELIELYASDFAAKAGGNSFLVSLCCNHIESCESIWEASLAAPCKWHA